MRSKYLISKRLLPPSVPPETIFDVTISVNRRRLSASRKAARIAACMRKMSPTASVRRDSGRHWMSVSRPTESTWAADLERESLPGPVEHMDLGDVHLAAALRSRFSTNTPKNLDDIFDFEPVSL